MHPLGWLAAVFAFFFAQCGAIIVALDVYFVRQGRQSISDWCLRTSRSHPHWHILFWAWFFLSVALLLCHLYTGWPTESEQ